jgi:uncharacterized protein YyaL (SSP411 family)
MLNMTRIRRARGALAATLAAALATSTAKELTVNVPANPTSSENQLRHATSPYLLQHADNPVAWQEWGPAALEEARRADKPIFLSIGYSACHWCHVMAHESFEDQAVAEVLNRHFVNIKVDREERPDIDEIYMQATMIMNRGQGGWPMSVWLTPDLKPFYAGTYFPPTPRWGRPGFRDLCARIAEFWHTRRDDLRSDADRLAHLVSQSLVTPPGQADPTLATIDHAADTLAGLFDPHQGGLISGGTNKFPPSLALDLLLRSAHRHGPAAPRSQYLLRLVELTLDRMAHGGIYDHLAGGICRYSTDVEWHVPHFEKMLYDQALVSRSYLDAYQHTGKPLYARIAREICDYVLADLQDPAGGFYSSRDADSEGEEGKYYVWQQAEIAALLGQDDGRLFRSYYDVSAAGNWRDPHAPDQPKNILRVPRDLETVARLNDVDPGELAERLAIGRRKLLEARDQRVPPGRDDKIIVEWNGLMIASLARASAVLAEPRYAQAAARAADFILTNQYQDGRLRRTYRAGRTLEAAFLTDYAALIDGLIELYEATFERRWLEQAVALNSTLTTHYYDEHHGGYYFTPDDHEQLIARAKGVHDGATPAGNSLQLMNLLRLNALLGDGDCRARAAQMMRAFAADVAQSPVSSERFLAAAEFALAGPVEFAVIGPPADPQTQALLARIHRAYIPNRVITLHDPSQAEDSITAPQLANRSAVAGRPTAYVCRDRTCLPPVTTPAELDRQLAGQSESRTD